MERKKCNSHRYYDDKFCPDRLKAPAPDLLAACRKGLQLISALQEVLDGYRDIIPRLRPDKTINENDEYCQSIVDSIEQAIAKTGEK